MVGSSVKSSKEEREEGKSKVLSCSVKLNVVVGETGPLPSTLPHEIRRVGQSLADREREELARKNAERDALEWFYF